VAQTETDGQEVLETREWVDSLDYVLSKGGPVRAGDCCSNWHCTRGAPRE
jgi:pyruvate dehydrogenase complex dehydrogenase (E1) component